MEMKVRNKQEIEFKMQTEDDSERRTKHMEAILEARRVWVMPWSSSRGLSLAVMQRHSLSA
ncbi:MAG: hypothetical protein ABSE82_16350, partial [Nitrososphaerales archaeon]